jgi:hypothetical protein
MTAMAFQGIKAKTAISDQRAHGEFTLGRRE